MKLDPECKKERNIFFVKADATFLPCCYLSSNPVLLEYLGQDMYAQLNLNSYTYEQIINSEAWHKIMSSIESDDPIIACTWTCGKKRDEDRDLAGNKKSTIVI